MEEKLAIYEKMDLEDGIDFFKSDVYSLGVIMINLMTLSIHEKSTV